MTTTVTDVLGSAEQAIETISSTAAKVNQAYATSQNAIQTGRRWYTYWQEGWSVVWPYLQKAWQWWLIISDNNDPKRILIIVIVLLVVWLLFKRSRRRSFYDRYYNR